MARVFTDEELREMGTETVELVLAAISANDPEKAKKMARRMHREFASFHGLYRTWVTGLLTFIGRRYGDEVLQEALKETCAVWLRPLAEEYDRCNMAKNYRRKAELMAGSMRGNLAPVRIEEDDEKFIFHLEECGSGGRLVRDGCYNPPMNFLKLKKPQPMTCYQADFPVYCAHGLVLAMLGIEWTGAPLFFEEPSEKVGERPCKVYVYKDPRDTPAEFYAKVGKQRGNPEDRSNAIENQEPAE